MPRSDYLPRLPCSVKRSPVPRSTGACTDAITSDVRSQVQPPPGWNAAPQTLVSPAAGRRRAGPDPSFQSARHLLDTAWRPASPSQPMTGSTRYHRLQTRPHGPSRPGSQRVSRRQRGRTHVCAQHRARLALDTQVRGQSRRSRDLFSRTQTVFIWNQTGGSSGVKRQRP